MRNLDDLLHEIGRTPVPELAWLDSAVVAAFAVRQSEMRATSRLLSAAAVLALGFGYASGSMMSTPARAADNNLVIVETPLAPSILLDFL